MSCSHRQIAISMASVTLIVLLFVAGLCACARVTDALLRSAAHQGNRCAARFTRP
jgi:hypothetical protein